MSRSSAEDVKSGFATPKEEMGRIHCQTCGTAIVLGREKRLLTRCETERYLNLAHEKVQSLLNTRQITSIGIKGEDRFDSCQLDLLIETYKQTAERRA